ncbi:MAG: NAD(P)-dependent oxidoreductase [Actinomycetota bacterium]|nr:NAD(P)-dependent oxidoreductase [Actinomycetota bacterium]
MSGQLALVTGATGYIASHLVPALVGAGWEVRACGRRERPEHLPDSVEFRQADLAGDDDLGPLVAGLSHVFHLAGASSSKSSDEEMQRDNGVATARLLDAARAAGMERFLHMSSTSVYGEEVQLPLPVREDVEPHPSRSYGKAKWAAEEAVWKAGEDDVAVVVLRPVSVYGPGAIKLVGSAVLDVAIERFAGLDRLAVATPPIEQRLLHVGDLVRACLHLAVHDGAVGRAFNVVSSTYPSSHEIARILAGQFDMEVELSEDQDCGLSCDERAEVRDRMLAEGMRDHILLTKERFRFMRKSNRNNRLSIDALLETGFEFGEDDLESSLQRNVAWYRDNKWVL